MGSGVFALWPGGCGIHQTQVLIRKGPELSGSATYIAFVVWNDSVVGHIYTVATADDTDFHGALDNALATRTNAAPNRWGGGGGGPDGGTPPVPHPHVDNFTVTQAFLDNHVKTASAAITAAEHDVIITSTLTAK